MNFDNKTFQQKYEAWKNGADYWKDIRGINLGGDTQAEEPTPEEQEQMNAKVQSILNEYDAGKDVFTYDIAKEMKDPLPQFKGGKNNYINEFVNRLAPLVGQQLNRYGYNNDAAFYNVMRQLAWESNYGRSNVARKYHNYGGVGYNGKTYTSYKNDEEFVKNYIRLMHNRYDAALRAKSTQDYARALKNKGYYQDTLANYTNGLRGMDSVVKASAIHRMNHKNDYNYAVQLKDVIQDYDDAKANSPVMRNLPSYEPSTKQPSTINATVPITLLGPSEEEIKAEQYNKMNQQAFDEITTPTPLPPMMQKMLQGNNFGKDAYGQKFWQRRGMNLHFDDGKDPYLYTPTDYDFVQARDLGYQPGPDGHWPSRNYKTGRYLKSPVHPTLYKGIIADNSLGYYPYYKDGAIYTNTWQGNEPYTGMIENYIQYRSKKKKGAKK